MGQICWRFVYVSNIEFHQTLITGLWHNLRKKDYLLPYIKQFVLQINMAEISIAWRLEVSNFRKAKKS
jgi:ribosomal 30S subunit maturation factor RimM